MSHTRISNERFRTIMRAYGLTDYALAVDEFKNQFFATHSGVLATNTFGDFWAIGPYQGDLIHCALAACAYISERISEVF